MSDTGAYQMAFEQARKLLSERQFDLALEQVDAILAVHPRDAKTNFLRAVVLRNMGRHDEAIPLLTALTRGTQGVAVIYQELGYALHAVGRIDDAIDALRQAVKLDSTLAGSWRLLGESLHGEGEAAEASHAFKQAMQASHTHPGIIKALDLIQQERYGMAEGICRDYLQRNPTDVTVIRLLAEIGIKGNLCGVAGRKCSRGRRWIETIGFEHRRIFIHFTAHVPIVCSKGI